MELPSKPVWPWFAVPLRLPRGPHHCRDDRTMSTARILIADDHELFRRGLVSALADKPEWSVVAEAADGRQACELAARLMPEIAVLDLTMPHLNGLDATRQMRVATPKTRIVIVTAHESEQLV